MKAQTLSQHFTPLKLIQFTLSTILMMIFMSLYTAVDGAFVSKFVSEDALSAINIVYPAISLIYAVSLMLATGGNAVISTHLGEQDHHAAKSFFTLLYGIGLLCGLAIGLLGILFLEPLLKLLGSTPRLDRYASAYLKLSLLFSPMIFLQMFAQNFLVTAGKPHVGLLVTFIGGIVNIVLDYVFIKVLNMGISGAAWATGIGYSIPGLFALNYFFRQKKGSLHFIKPSWDGKKLFLSCLNGSSELINNLSIALTTFLFNVSMLNHVGEDGVAAISVIFYIQFIQAAIYYGYSQGVSPIISYKYGETNYPQLHKVVTTSMFFTLISSVVIFIFSIAYAQHAVSLFISSSSPVFLLAKRGFILFSYSYLFMGLNIFITTLFTALGNGKISALLSFLRTFIFIVGALILLPNYLGVDGIWLAVPVAEACALVISWLYYKKLRPAYSY